jgi:hypothetical protein
LVLSSWFDKLGVPADLSASLFTLFQAVPDVGKLANLWREIQIPFPAGGGGVKLGSAVGVGVI